MNRKRTPNHWAKTAALTAATGLLLSPMGATVAMAAAPTGSSDNPVEDAVFAFTGAVTESTSTSVVPVHVYIVVDNSGSINSSQSAPAIQALAQTIFKNSTHKDTKICVTANGGSGTTNCATNVNQVNSVVNSATNGNSDDHYRGMSQAIHYANADTTKNAKKVAIYIGDDGDSAGYNAAEDSWGVNSWKHLPETDADLYVFANTTNGSHGGAAQAAKNAGIPCFTGSSSSQWQEAFEQIGSLVSKNTSTMREVAYTIPFNDTVEPNWGSNGTFDKTDITLTASKGTIPDGWTAAYDDEKRTLTVTLPKDYTLEDGQEIHVNTHVTAVTIPDCSKAYDPLTVGDATVTYREYINDIPAETKTVHVAAPTIPAVQECSVEFDANKGAGNMGTWHVKRGQTGQLPANTYTRTGYTFTGWARTADASQADYADQANYAGSVDETLHALWQANPASITYNANHGTGTTSPTEGVTDQTVHAASSQFTRTGYTFTGWNTKPNGKGTLIHPNDAVTLPAGGITLYAQWAANPATLTFSRNSDEATGIVNPIDTHYDATVKLQANGYQLTGHTFTGWNTKQDGHGDTYQPRADYKVTGSQTFHAIWQANPSALTYDANGGTGSMADTTGVTGQTVTLAANTYQRDGYTFTGWNTKPNGMGNGYADTGTLTLPAGGVTLYAQWSPNQASLAYNGNGGTGSMTGTMGVTDQTVNAAETLYTRTGWTFTGWNTKADGTGTPYQPGSPIQLTPTPIILYAQWAPNPASISYDVNAKDATGNANTAVSQHGEPVTINPGTTLKRPGYKFTHWNTQADGTGVDYQPGQSAQPAPGTNATLYAQWEALPASVTYDRNHPNATGSTETMTGVTDQQVTISQNGYKLTGYKFTGWNTQADGTGTTVQPGDTLTMTDSQTILYAQWEARPATLTFSPNVKTTDDDPDSTPVEGHMDTMEGVTDQTVLLPSNGYKRDGYDFTGWNTSPNGDGNLHKPGDPYKLPAGDTTLYAQWEAAKATVSFDANGGTGSMTPFTDVTDTHMELPDNQYQRDGWTFTGWNTKADGTGDAYKPGATIRMIGDIILYAQWEQNPASPQPMAQTGIGVTGTLGVLATTLAAAGAAAIAHLTRKRRAGK